MIVYKNWNVDEKFILQNKDKIAWLDDSYLSMAEIATDEPYYPFLVQIRDLKTDMYIRGVL